MLPAMQRLADWLDKSGKTQEELAQLLGVAQASISEWVTGRALPTLKNLRALSTRTGISIDELLETAKPKGKRKADA